MLTALGRGKRYPAEILSRYRNRFADIRQRVVENANRWT
jgi:hypothetical protein